MSTLEKNKKELLKVIERRCSHPRYPHGCQECNFLRSLVFKWHIKTTSNIREEILMEMKKHKKAVTYKDDNGHGWAVPMAVLQTLKLNDK